MNVPTMAVRAACRRAGRAMQAAVLRTAVLARRAGVMARRQLRPLRQQLDDWWQRCRAGTLRLSLGTRILIVMIFVGAMSTTFCVLLQDSRLSADLRRASRSQVQRAASVTGQLLEERLAAQLARYRTLAVSPQLRANLEAGHQPTLAFYAEQLQPEQDAAAIVFLDANDNEVAGAGDADLRAAAVSTVARGAFAANGFNTRWLACGEQLFAIARVAIGGPGELRGSVMGIEAITPDQLVAWSRLCGARVSIGPRIDADLDGDGDAPVESLPARTVGQLQVRVAIPFATADEALANSRDNLLSGGMLGLSMALAASLLLARHVVRPIRAIQGATERIAKGQLDVRLDQGRNDEVGDVARSFNLMLDNLQRNMRERSSVENQVSHLAFHDSLTGLPNRRLLKERLAKAIEKSQSRQRPLALLFLDLDRFKNVNDTLGHSAGDSLLLAVACRLHTCLENYTEAHRDIAAEALLARLGGDEFTMVLPDIANREQVAELADQVVASLSAPFEVVGQEVSVTASVGIALAPDDGKDVETLLRDSDMAMFHAKGRGGSGYEFYADSMEEIAARRLALENKLHRALEAGEFELFYQPKLELETNTITGLEALLRWRTEDGQHIAPDEFVPIAEETGAIIAIGEWVLRTAITQSLAWQREGLRPVRIAVNVSARQIAARGDFVGVVRRILEETGFDPKLLELEITESSLLNDSDGAVAILRQIRELGVGLSLDDFGTGYSSLSYLRQMPIDTVKIDRSFIQGADDNPADVALVGSIVAMANVLGLRVVVEGVETRKQRRFLEMLGADEIQGYLISRPVPTPMVADLLRRKPRRRRTPAVLRRPRGAAKE
jgi:diguanylate cyclase (GGDEF)-like protein